MLNFFRKKILNNLRNRTYFQEYTQAGTIKSEGAWRITITQQGTNPALITDGGNNTRVLAPAFVGLEGLANQLILEGEPYIIRDDELTLAFDETVGGNNLVYVQFDRLVTKKEDNDYPQDRLMNQE